MTWAAVGSFVGAGNSATGYTNTTVGDLRIYEVLNFSNSTVWASSLSGGGCTWVQAGVKFSGTTNAFSAAVFLGTVTATGAQTPTINWSGTAPASFGTATQEFSSTVGSWVFDVQGNLDSAGTSNWVSLTPSFGAGELYFGYAGAGTAAQGSTSGYIYNQNIDGSNNGAAYNVNCPGSATFPVWADATQLFGIMILVAESASSSPARPHIGGKTWRRLFRHRQLALAGPAPVAAAGPQVFQVQPLRNTRVAGRGRLGRAGACAAGIMAVTTLSPQPASVPPARPQPVIQHPAPHRAIIRRNAGPPSLPFLTAKLPPTAISPRPPHRATGKGILATTTLSPQPTSVPGPQWRQPFAPRPAHRVLWRAVAGPAPAVVNVAAVPPSRPQPVTNRPPAPHRAITRRILAPPAPLGPPSRPQPVTNRPPPPHRAIGKGVLATTTLSAQPARVPPPQWRQPNAPRPAHRATWRAVAGPAPAVVVVTTVPPARPQPVTNRPPVPHRAITRRVLAPPAPLAPPARPQPVINRPPAPHRATGKGILAKTTLSAQPASVPPPHWRPPPAPRLNHRAVWRAVAGPPPAGGAIVPQLGTVTVTDSLVNRVIISDGLASTVTISDGLAASVQVTDMATGSVTVRDFI